jgi:CRISPR-associated protein Cmr3
MNSSVIGWYRLEPVDAWYFRDGRPSNRGEEQSDIESLFPPNASTVVGAFRAALARGKGWDGKSDWNNELIAVLGNGYDDLGQLSFAGPFLMKGRELLFPMPAHVLGRKNDGPDILFEPCDWLEPSADPVTCDMGRIRLPLRMGMYQTEIGEKEPSSPEGFFINSSGMQKIINGELPLSKECFHISQLFCRESRVGIARDANTMACIEGEIYSPVYTRLKYGISLVMGIAGIPDNWSLPAYFPLGGESRLASCESVFPEFSRQQVGEENSILMLVTPGYFPNGNWWGAGPGESAEKLASILSGRVSSAVFDRPSGIGGWDSLKNQSLPMRPFVTPGAVWWIEGNGSAADSTEGFIQIGKQTRHGYGIAFLGRQPVKSVRTCKES